MVDLDGPAMAEAHEQQFQIHFQAAGLLQRGKRTTVPESKSPRPQKSPPVTIAGCQLSWNGVGVAQKKNCFRVRGGACDESLLMRMIVHDKRCRLQREEFRSCTQSNETSPNEIYYFVIPFGWSVTAKDHNFNLKIE